MAVKTLAFIRIREVPGSILGPEFGCLDLGFLEVFLVKFI